MSRAIAMQTSSVIESWEAGLVSWLFVDVSPLIQKSFSSRRTFTDIRQRKPSDPLCRQSFSCMECQQGELHPGKTALQLHRKWCVQAAHIIFWRLQQPWRTDANTVAWLNCDSLKTTGLQNGNNVSWLWTKWEDTVPCRAGGTVHTEHVHKLELRWSNALHSLPLVTGQWHTQLMSPHLWIGLTGNNNNLRAKNETVTQNLSGNVPSNELGKTLTGSCVFIQRQPGEPPVKIYTC